MSDNVLSAFLGAIIGGILTLITEIILRKIDEKQKEKHYASILYYDLKSIEDYILNERSSVNIRYSFDWQGIVSNCTFLKPDYVKILYNIYDLLYNFNYHFQEQKKVGESRQKDDIDEFRKLKAIFSYNPDNIYNNILEQLSDKIGK